MSFWCSNLPDFEEVMYGGRTGGARDGSEVGGESPARKYGCRSVAVDAWLVVRNCFFFCVGHRTRLVAQSSIGASGLLLGQRLWDNVERSSGHDLYDGLGSHTDTGKPRGFHTW